MLHGLDQSNNVQRIEVVDCPLRKTASAAEALIQMGKVESITVTRLQGLVSRVSQIYSRPQA
jgi:hypothetical protein